MTGRVGIRRRLIAIVAAVPLAVALALAWQVRPPLPPRPRSFTAPFPAGSGTAILDLASWGLVVMLDLILWWSVLAYGSRREPTAMQRRVARALRWPQHQPHPPGPPDWRRHTAAVEPVMRLHAPPPQPAAAPARSARDQRESGAEGAVHGTGKDVNGQIGVRLLGPFELIGTERPRRRATAQLLAYLALHPAGAGRDELLEALWPDEDPARSAEWLWQATPEARKLLGDAFCRRRDFYWLDRHRLAIDIDELEQLRGHLAAAGGLEDDRAIAERALALFRGEPLTGIDAMWANGEARRLQAIRLELLEWVGRLRLQAGQPAGALAAAEQGATYDRRNELFIRLAMEAEAKLGRRDAVADRYQRLCRELSDEFGLEPERESKLLYRRLLSQDAAACDYDNKLEHAAG